MTPVKILLTSGFGRPPAATLEEAYQAGRRCALSGASLDNCHFKYFATPEHTAEWERGKREAETGTPG